MPQKRGRRLVKMGGFQSRSTRVRGMAADGEGGDERLRVLVVRGSFAALGGAERELLQLLRNVDQRWDVGLATLDLPEDARSLLDGADVRIHQPSAPMEWPTGAVAELLASSSKKASKAWQNIDIPFDEYDAVHISVCRGSLELLPKIPATLPVHYHCLEPPRWLYEDVLHRRIDGTPKRPLWVTKLIFTLQRRRDQRYVRRLIQRPHSTISGNSPWIQQWISELYGIESNPAKANGEPPRRDAQQRLVEATHLMHVIDLSMWPQEATADESKALEEVPVLPSEYVVTVGQVSHVKGAWSTVESLRNTGLALVQVGGGSEEDKAALVQRGTLVGVEVVCMPRLSQVALRALIRGSRAMVSHAHKEPFGLTPIEAMAIGVPALMVDEGGFADTMAKSNSGRLIARDDWGAWKAAYLDAKDDKLRKRWSQAGRPYVEQHFSMEVQIEALERLLRS